MDDFDSPSPSSTPSLHWPLAILALAIAVLLASEIASSKQNARIIAWQRENLEKQISNLKQADKRMAEAVVNREVLVKQSGELQKQLEELLNDVLDLAKTDDDAQQVITKWNVKRNAPPAAPADEKSAAKKP